MSLRRPGTTIYFDPSADSSDQFITQTLVRKEIRGGDMNTFLGGRNQQLEKNPGASHPTGSRAAADDQDSATLLGRLRKVGKIVGTDQQFARSLKPVLRKSGLEVKNRRALNFDHRVAPPWMFWAAFEPLVGNSGTPDEAGLPVDNQQFPDENSSK